MCSCGANRRPDNPARGNPSPPAAPAQQCPPACGCGTTRWIDEQAYCGDNARLEGSLTGNPPDGPATIEVLRADGTVAEVLNAQMVGGHVTATWVCKAQTANWRTDRHRFRFTAAGVTCTSSNEFTFRNRPTTNWVLRNVPYPSGNGFAPAHEKHDAQLESNRVHYRLRLRLAGAPFGPAKRRRAKRQIENAWNNGFNNKTFHRRNCQRGRACNCTFDCCKVGFRLDVYFVNRGQHLTVTVVASPPPPAVPPPSSMNGNGGQWYDPPAGLNSEYAHETGHVLGQHDEYSVPPGAIDPTGVQPAIAPIPNLMSTLGNTTLFIRHYRRVLRFLNNNAGGDQYETINP